MSAIYGGLRRTSARVSSHGDARGHAMTIASNLGFPRIGRHRELKSALERFWSGDLDEAGPGRRRPHTAEPALEAPGRTWNQPRPVRRFLPV